MLGTYTHIPTADTRILPGGRAYQTDVGMTDPYDSVIGSEKNLAISLNYFFKRQAAAGPLKPGTISNLSWSRSL